MKATPRSPRENSRLHAAWNRSNPTRDGMHPILDVTGQGQYVGNFLQVDTKYQGWWGEGDTIFHVDGKASTHTPGTEDEYGACWGFDHTYSYVYSGYIQMDEGQNRMYRWYLANPVRFQKSLEGGNPKPAQRRRQASAQPRRLHQRGLLVPGGRSSRPASSALCGKKRAHARGRLSENAAQVNRQYDRHGFSIVDGRL